jgi:hypothetical protein
MNCLCEECGMNEENFGDMNYSDEFTRITTRKPTALAVG